MLSAYNRPQPAGQGYVSISAGGVLGDRIEWPVFGEQIDDLTASTRPEAEIYPTPVPVIETAALLREQQYRQFAELYIILGYCVHPWAQLRAKAL